MGTGQEDDDGLSATVLRLTSLFFDDQHYRLLQKSLSKQWSRMNSLAAALQLMEQYGVQITAEESQRIMNLPEDQQISALVMRMPQQTNEQFQHFFLQLQLLVSTATRVRQGLEEGQPAWVEAALTDADSTGVAPFILRMCITQAGSEVAMVRERYEAWVKDANTKLGKLIRGQEDARMAQERLAEAQAQMMKVQSKENDKLKYMLMAFMSSSGSGLLNASFNAWRDLMKQMKHENEVYKEFAERIERAEGRLMDFKVEQSKSVRSMMVKKGDGLEEELILEVFQIWHDDWAHEKDVRENAHKVEELSAKMKQMQKNQADGAKKFLTHLNLEGDVGILRMGWLAWLGFHHEYHLDKEHEEQVKEKEKRLASYFKEKGEKAKHLLAQISGGTDFGAVKNAWDGWKTFCEDAKKEAVLAEKLQESQCKCSAFRERNKHGAKGVMEKARQHTDQMLQLTCFGQWHLYAKVEFCERLKTAKMEAKQCQLVGVQHMFRSFAQQLEVSLKDGQHDAIDDDYSRYQSDPRPPRKGLSKADASVSLPDISGRPGSLRPPTPSGLPPQLPKRQDAWS